MKEIFIADDFSVDELTEKISNLMSKWSIKMLDINGPSWVIYDQDMEVKFLFFFEVDFNDIETRLNHPIL